MCSDIDDTSSGTAVKMSENIKLLLCAIKTLFFCLTLMLTVCPIFRNVEHPVVCPVDSTLGYIYEDMLSMLSIRKKHAF